ncbi:hypothetical protein ACFZ8E_02770 [Methylobacterium sp. HMF5984]|uniref:hypothetical protein n=1 Tax=Methylobacterium sp. HMF5984 TaxID=3367370 RepID=UPI003851DC63
MTFKLFARRAIAQIVEARVREIVSVLDEDKVAHDAGAPAGEASAPRLIHHMRTDVTTCDDAPDWAEISVGFGSLNPGIAGELWGLIVMPRTMRTFDPAEVTFVAPTYLASGRTRRGPSGQ